jgi:flagellar FliL protein
MAKKEKPPKSDAPEGAEGEAPAKKKLPMPILLAAAGGAVLLLGGGGAAAYFLFLKPKPAAEAGADGKGKEQKSAKAEKKKSEKGGKGGKEGEEEVSRVTEGPDGVLFYAVPDFVVNISTGNGRPAYLKRKLTLETKDQATVDALEPALPRVMDAFTGFLRELRMEDLSGSAGAYRLRLELLRRVNLAIAPAQVDAVLIEEMLVQ